MRAMILSAGRGERMRPFTDHTPKPLLTVQGKPLIVYHLEAFAKMGILEVVINLGHLGDKIKAFLGTGSQFGIHIEYSPEDPILETGGGIANALPLLGSDPFLVVSADVLTDFPFNKLPSHPEGLMHLVLTNNPDYHPKGDFAIEAGKILDPSDPNTQDKKLNFGGIAIYRPELFHDCPQGIFPLSHLFKKAIALKAATGEHYTGQWFNIGTNDQLISAETLYRNPIVF